jgi:hypothetical protein
MMRDHQYHDERSRLAHLFERALSGSIMIPYRHGPRPTLLSPEQCSMVADALRNDEAEFD